MDLSLQITDISNDTFIWGPWINGFIKAPKLQVLYHDLEKINQDLLSGNGADICKVSFQILPEISHEYVLLSVGSTIVDGLTPKIVSKKKFSQDETCNKSLAIPGFNTTAYLLTTSFLPSFANISCVAFDKLKQKVNSGEFDAALLIHESSLSLKDQNLIEVFNLGSMWKEKTQNLPIPLGGVVVRRSLGEKTIHIIKKNLELSLKYARDNYDQSIDYVLSKSKVKDMHSIQNGIRHWVNDETMKISPKGYKSIAFLGDLYKKKLTNHFEN
ncbi:MAG: hypothetical protein CMP11_05785 [Zetaproteobacteria bacterium]|nr:hypothetical protein [Pseudobdellovibrionaceae bacterium]